MKRKNLQEISYSFHTHIFSHFFRHFRSHSLILTKSNEKIYHEKKERMELAPNADPNSTGAIQGR